jgi:hypothetical protein
LHGTSGDLQILGPEGVEAKGAHDDGGELLRHQSSAIAMLRRE